MIIKKGDLVQYTSHPHATVHRVIPGDEFPVGLVICVKESVTRGGPKMRAIIRTVIVKWSDEKWNSKEGVSEEFEPDLKLIQRI
ncbi:hypothetical protein CMI47_19170 [Candidatus Pacearchaeota archaeon]|nr:hypothetical protein [Candidatus Pacearchaeota archaeon]|tara:strand:+ start:7677 stop:7928 length:252 start_codon:yes stop_codon:yes gene_type:complete